MDIFKIKSNYKPAGDQPEAIKKLLYGLRNNYSHQTLLGVTGSGKTYTMAKIIEAVKELRQNGVDCFFTIDAGPNVKVLCLEKNSDQIKNAMQCIANVVFY